MDEDLFEVDFGDSGTTPMIESGVTQTDNKTVDDIPQEKNKDTKATAFELVDEIIDNAGEDTDEPEENADEEINEKTKQTPSPAKETNDASDSFAFVFANLQQEEGNLSFELDEKELKEVIKKEGEAGAMAYLFNKETEFREARLKEMYDEDAREYIALKDAGADTDTAKELIGNKTKFETLTDEVIEENEDIRKAVLTQNYKNTTNFTDEKIKKLVDRAITTGEDIDEAKEALPAIKEFNKQQIEAEKKRLADEAKAETDRAKVAKDSMVKKINDAKEIIPGSPLSKVEKKDIEKMITEPVKLKDGRVTNGVWAKFQENPEDSLLKLAYLMKSGIWDGKLDNLEKKAKTAAAKKMEDVIKGKSNGINKGSSTADAGDDDAMSSMKGIFKL